VIVVRDDKFGRGWTPVPLRPVFWIPLVLFMMLLGVALEIVLHFSDKNLGTLLIPIVRVRFYLNCCIGWPISGAMANDSGFVHFLYVRISVIHYYAAGLRISRPFPQFLLRW
jgi:hypothetical protein